MKRVLIIGPNCSGKTTFSRRLRDKLAMPLVHLDALYWLDNWEVRPRDEFNRLLDIELNEDSWIMDGNMKKSLTKRLFSNLGKSRPDMGGICVERLDRRSLCFIRTVLLFNRNNREDFRKLLEKAEDRGVRVIVFRSYREVGEYLENL